MSFLTDGLYHPTAMYSLPGARVVPGVIDPRLYKFRDVAIPGGPAINLRYHDEDPSDMVQDTEPQPIAKPNKKLLTLGDEIHTQMPQQPDIIRPKIKTEFATIPATTLTTQDRYRR